MKIEGVAFMAITERNNIWLSIVRHGEPAKKRTVNNVFYIGRICYFFFFSSHYATAPYLIEPPEERSLHNFRTDS